MTPLRITAAAVAALSCASVSAQTERELDAHEHGAAALDIVLDGASLYIDLRTPAANVLGFEHSPETPEQREAVEAVRAVLETGEPFVPDASGGCTLDGAEVDIALADEEHGHDEHGDEDHDAHGDEDEHGDEDHDAHGDEDEHGEEDHDAHGDEGEHGDEDHDAHAEESGHGDDDHDAHGDEHDDEEHHDEHADADGETHSDIEVSYVFLCDAPEALGGVATTLFERFDGFEDIDVQLVGPGGQTAAELTAENPRVSFDAVR